MQDPVEQIKAKLDIVDVVSPYVELKKAGRNYKGLCPFHKEKTPSFMVSQEKQLAYCFSCRKGGDMFSFLQEVEGVEFADALKLLAERAGVKVQEAVARTSSSDKKKIYEVLEVTAGFFRSTLQEPGAVDIRSYLTERGMTAEDVEQFSIGFAPTSNKSLVEFLLKRGYTKEEMLKAGVVIGKDVEGKQVYDRFSGRIMFALHDDQGRVVGFAGRIVHTGEPKYLNIPETQLYHKGKLLYGWHLAKNDIRTLDQVIVVEGYMDVIACHRAGVRHVVGVSGTALTTEHIQLINRLTKNIVLCFDEDSAGFEAKKRSFEIASAQDVNVLTMSIEGGKDPDEVIRTHPELFIEASQNAIPFISDFIERTARKYNLENPTEQKQFTREVFYVLQHTQSALEQEFYLKRIAVLLHAQLRTVFGEFRHFVAQLRKPRVAVSKTESISTPMKTFGREEVLVGMVLVYPELLPILTEKISVEEIVSEKTKTLYKLLVSKYTGARSVATSYTPEEERALREYMLVSTLYIEEHYATIPAEDRERIYRTMVGTHAKALADDQLRSLHATLRNAQKLGDRSAEQRIMEEITQLLPRKK